MLCTSEEGGKAKFKSRGVLLLDKDEDDSQFCALKSESTSQIISSNKCLRSQTKVKAVGLQDNLKPMPAIQMLSCLYSNDSEDESDRSISFENECVGIIKHTQKSILVRISDENVSDTEEIVRIPKQPQLRSEQTLQSILQSKSKQKDDSSPIDSFSDGNANYKRVPYQHSVGTVSHREDADIITNIEFSAESSLSFSEMTRSVMAPASRTSPSDSASDMAHLPLAILHDNLVSQTESESLETPAPLSFSMMLVTSASHPPSQPRDGDTRPPPAAAATSATAPSESTSASYRSNSPQPRSQRGSARGSGRRSQQYSKYPRRQSSYEAALEHANIKAKSDTDVRDLPRDRGDEEHFDRSRPRSYSPRQEQELDKSHHTDISGTRHHTLREQYSLHSYGKGSPVRTTGNDRYTSRSFSPDSRYYQDRNYSPSRDRDDYRNRATGSGAVGTQRMKRKATAPMDDYETSLLEYESDNDNYRTNRFKTKNSKNITLV